MGAMTSIPVLDGTSLPAYVARPAADPAPTGVIVAHELFGVNPDIRGVADDLAGAGYLAIAPEFYHRDAPPGRWLERDDAGRQEGFGYLHRLGREQALADVAAAMAWLCAEPGIERVAVVGFSAGGHLSYLAACRLPVSRTAVLYGGWLPGTDIPLSQPDAHAGADPGDHRPAPVPGRRGRHADRRGAAGADPRRAGGGRRGPRAGQLPGRAARVLLAGHAAVQPGGPGRRVAPDTGVARVLGTAGTA